MCALIAAILVPSAVDAVAVVVVVAGGVVVVAAAVEEDGVAVAWETLVVVVVALHRDVCEVAAVVARHACCAGDVRNVAVVVVVAGFVA